jgi:hypothetical protein
MLRRVLPYAHTNGPIEGERQLLKSGLQSHSSASR